MSLTIEEIFAVFDQPPEKAIELLKAKGIAITWSADDFAAMEQEAFTVAKVMQLDVLQDLYGEIESALEKGKTFHDFQKSARERLTAKGWNGEHEVTNPDTGETKTVNLGTPWRLRTIFDTNLQSSYMAGRWLGMQETKETRPYAQIRSTIDNRTTQQCRELDGKVFALDDPIWAYIYPPGHIRCRRRVVSVNKRYVERKGLTIETAENYPRERWANAAGFDKHPTKRWQPDLSKYNKDFVKQYKTALKVKP